MKSKPFVIPEEEIISKLNKFIEESGTKKSDDDDFPAVRTFKNASSRGDDSPVR
jgi:hypothetical protein